MNNFVYDHNDTLKYKVEGSVCQIGMCCPCCGAVEFPVTNTNGQAVGLVSKRFDGLSEICLGTNKFTIDFPPEADANDRKLLLAATMLVDLQYFEQNKNNSNN